MRLRLESCIDIVRDFKNQCGSTITFIRATLTNDGFITPSISQHYCKEGEFLILYYSMSKNSLQIYLWRVKYLLFKGYQWGQGLLIPFSKKSLFVSLENRMFKLELFLFVFVWMWLEVDENKSSQPSEFF